MLPSFCRDEVTVTTPATAESRGATVADWSEAVQTTVMGSLQPTQMTGEHGIRVSVDEAATLYCPPGTQISRLARVSFHGRDYAVDGEPFEWRSPSGLVTHVEVRLRRWAG